MPKEKRKKAHSQDPKNGRVDFLTLPDELLLALLSFLKPYDLLALGAVNRRLREMTTDETLWRDFNAGYFPDHPTLSATQLKRTQMKLPFLARYTLLKRTLRDLDIDDRTFQTLIADPVLIEQTSLQETDKQRLYNVCFANGDEATFHQLLDASLNPRRLPLLTDRSEALKSLCFLWQFGCRSVFYLRRK